MISAPETTTTVLPKTPYRGIESFRFSDHGIFFARDDEIRNLLRLIVIYRGVLLYGESGSGKSSLVNAGLIPEAASEGLRADRIRVQPRSGEELVVERISLAESGSDFLPSSLADDSDAPQIVLPAKGLRERLAAVAGDESRPLLIFDQFEELITLFEEAPAPDAVESALECQRRIVDVLVDVLNDETLPVKLLFSFREDYLAKVQKLLERNPELVDQSLRLTPPGTDALPRIIRGPFEDHPGHFGRELSVGLTERLTSAIERRSASGQVSLSEVEIVCLRLWESPNPDELLEKRHVRGILEDYLTESLDKFPQELHYLAIALLSQMVTSTGARNVVSADDLFERVHEDEPEITRERVEETLDELETKTKLVRREHRHELHLYEISSEFLVPWIARQRQERLKAREQRRVLERARQQRARLMFAFGILGTVLFVLGAAFGALAYYNWAQAEDERKAVRSQALALQAFGLLDLQTDARSRVGPDASVETAFRAYHSDRDTTEAEEAVRAALVESRRRAILSPAGEKVPMLSAAFSPDGKWVVTADTDGTTRIWNTSTGLQEGESLDLRSVVNSVSFNSDGTLVVTAGDDGWARVWDWRTWQSRAGFRHGAPVWSAAFSPDGKLVATAGDDRTARIWPATGGPALLRLQHTAPVRSAAFSRDGKLVMTGDADGTARLWNRSTGALLRALPQGGDELVAAFAFSPDGNFVVRAGQGPLARIWNVSTGRNVAVRGRPTDEFTSAEFSRDGRFVVTASANSHVHVWNRKGERLVTFRGHEDVSHDAAFSPDGKLIVSASKDGTARIWDAGTGRTADRVFRNDRALEGAVFSPDGTQLVTASDDGALTIWNVSTRSRVARLSGHTQPVLDAAFSADGTLVATASSDGTARVWDATTGVLRRDLRHGDLDPVQSVDFSPDGTLVVTTVDSDSDHLARVWDWTTGRRVLVMKHDGPLRDASFSPDGKLMLTIEDVETNIWDLAKRRRVGGFSSTERQTSGAFAPDGTRVITAQEDGTATIYSIRNPSDPQLVIALLGHDEGVTRASFSADGKFVATSSTDGEARVWESQSGRVLNVLRGHVGSVNSAVFSPLEGSPVVLTAGADGTARLFLCQACVDIEALIALGHWEPDFERTRD